ncbi:hypothetical protein JW835_12530 [bacterium]|nr:hypothetical protein [bacterium]
MKKLCFIFILLGASFLIAQPVFVPLNHRVYDFLDRMQCKGILSSQYGSYPFTRKEIVKAFIEIQKSIHTERLTESEISLFEQFKGEFVGDLISHDIKIQSKFHERHLLTWSESDGRYRADADLLLDQQIIRQSGDRGSTISHTTGGGYLRGQLTDQLGYFLHAYNTLRKGEAFEEEQFDPSRGAPIIISGKNTFTDNASAYFLFHLPHVNIEFGRDEARWGPGQQGNLMLSNHDAYFDMLRLQVFFTRFQFTSIHGKLNYTQAPKYLAAHRLEFRISPWLSVAGSELVIYGNRDIEPMYLNPLMPYHVAEHHLGDRDNNTMAFDANLFPWKNHKLYLELFLDDYTSSENPLTYYGNKWALLVGWRWLDLFGFRGWDLQMEYARIEPYVYTHQDSLNIYQQYGRSIGHWLGPNSDNVHIQIGYWVSRIFNSTFYINRTRHGEGDLYTPANRTESTRKKFLSGVVESHEIIGFEMEYQLLKDCYLKSGYSYHRVSNVLGERDKNKNYNQIQLHFQLNY